MPCCSIGDIVLRILRTAFVGTYCFVVVLFLACGVALVWLAGQVLWHGVMDVGTAQSARFDAILRTIGHLTIGVAALELGQTVLEEEVLRSTHVSGPTRARRFLSRFLVVVVVALAVESLIAVFHAASDTPEYLPHAASIALGAAVLLAAWGSSCTSIAVPRRWSRSRWRQPSRRTWRCSRGNQGTRLQAADRATTGGADVYRRIRSDAPDKSMLRTGPRGSVMTMLRGKAWLKRSAAIP